MGVKPKSKEAASAMSAPPPCYAVYYQTLVPIAREHGYALAIHGSMKRDCDLLAVPWVEDASEPVRLILAFKEAIQAVFTKHDFDHIGSVRSHATLKPHGRLAFSLHLTEEGCHGPYLDVSVMPKMRPSIAALTLEQDPLVALLRDVQAGNVSCRKAANEILNEHNDNPQPPR